VAQKAIRYGVPQQLNPQLNAIFKSPGYGLSYPAVVCRRSCERLAVLGKRAEIVAFNDEFRLRLYGL